LAGKWVFQPHDFDSSFELYSEGYRTKREAIEAAYLDLLALAQAEAQAEEESAVDTYGNVQAGAVRPLRRQAR
jgi:hypothetical protein